ncbi:MAG: NAD(P)/FAD-dependent oxidoreductase [Saprospiraceae bacterium]|nr:NAD(P)/FAD-dependent oxidoreductase [Saprospiraceae bacterium]MCF8248430.1 NAD(P)/FAD-dependent oxidoreductase [Saprospiraceae bacterium]MCF8280101.1 NAD(P)/FAD-dependent oxidoreductase [Bacteroidales bacterium]MCF8309958.1 NAD(P)/FAD-dependent oxidoreductase [Saprospiraceae bacterium]MCF8438711.1 NAD(P)/FAD-dependent oxidoreductase [Saprospiraceae bacterium]
MAHHQILIIGGGNAGLSIASQLLHKDSSLKIGIVEPSEKHYYQPAWTLVGAGIFDVNDTIKNEKDFIPKGTTWIKDAVATFQPEQNQVTCKSGDKHTYDYMVVVPGIQLDWHMVKGLKETLGKNGVTSNYLVEYATYTWELLRNFKGGNAIFTNPNTPIKCGGAPQKIMYLAGDYILKNGLQPKSNIHFYSGGSIIFGVKKYADTLNKVIARYKIQTHFLHNLVEVDGPNKKAWFEDENGNRVEETFEFIHVTPPQSAPDFIKNSPLAMPDNEFGWVDVDKFTTQHNRYPNIFSCGDASSLPNAKTGAAVRKQAPVLVQNLMHVKNGGQLDAKYTGYGSCPLVTGFGKLVLAEFDYDNNPMETFPFDQSKERWSMWMLKTKVLPWLYWNRILSGRA